ncbi:MAG: DNA gyrase subunit A, partial [Alphaproteobacteria bacterium]|nr:DNA gyrase subunit A [Alphaproteobacteria bacterium]
LMARSSEEVEVVAAFPVEDADQLLLMTDGGQLIRCPVTDIRKARRRTQGVRLFNIPEGARVVQVSHLADANGDDEAEDNGDEAPESGADAGDGAGEQE